MEQATIEANAFYYLNDIGKEVTRDEFLGEYFCQTKDPHPNNQKAFMLYVGSEIHKLRVAVLTWDESDAISTFEEWARNTGRRDEIGEDDDWRKAIDEAEKEEDEGNTYVDYPIPYYERYIEDIPKPHVVMNDES